jgi:hyperosmotically inducible periplasmic protein
MKLKMLIAAVFASVLLIASACSKQPERTYKDSVKTALEQADLKDVSVSEDADKNTITLGGALHSEEAKQKAGDVAKANAGPRAVANEVSVQPVGQESDAKSIASNLDDGIESNYKAALIEKGLNREHIKYDAKNGVLTLKGSVKSTTQRKEAEQIAQAVPNVEQVLNQLEVRR